jgi:hypothetical protein
MPCVPTILALIITRGDVHRIKVSEVELMEWYGKRAYVR